MDISTGGANLVGPLAAMPIGGTFDVVAHPERKRWSCQLVRDLPGRLNRSWGVAPSRPHTTQPEGVFTMKFAIHRQGPRRQRPRCVHADWLLHDSGPTPEHCGAWQVGTLDSPKGDIAPAMPAVWRYQIYPRKEKMMARSKWMYLWQSDGLPLLDTLTLKPVANSVRPRRYCTCKRRLE